MINALTLTGFQLWRQCFQMLLIRYAGMDSINAVYCAFETSILHDKARTTICRRWPTRFAGRESSPYNNNLFDNRNDDLI